MTKHMTALAKDFSQFLLPNAAISSWWLPLRLLRNIATHLRDQRDYEHLRDLPDYLLKDIGITRSELAKKDRHTLF